MSVLLKFFSALSSLFPRQLPVYEPQERVELCEVMHVLAYQESGYDLENQLTAARYITLQERNGARGVLSTGTMKNGNPMGKVVTGDKLLVDVRHNQHFPLEMKVLRVKEIYAHDKVEPIRLVV